MASVSSFLNRRAVTLPGNTFAREAAKVMRDSGIGCVLVTDLAGDLIGILTDRDLALAEPFGSAEAELPVSELMTPRPATVEESDSVDRAIRLMEELGIRRLPVTQGPTSKRCIGILTLDDLVIGKAIDSERLARVVKAQVARQILSTVTARRAWKAEATSEARREHTLHHFLNALAEKTGTAPAPLMQQIARFVLDSLVRRVQYREAVHLISQLPRDLHEDLLRNATGPDRSVTLESIQEHLVRDFGFDAALTLPFLKTFLSALADLTSPGAIEHLRSQLPYEFWPLFPPRAKGGKPSAA